MASGTTYAPDFQTIGAQVPKRIAAFANGTGLTQVIEQEISGKTDLGGFLAAMRDQYGF